MTAGGPPRGKAAVGVAVAIGEEAIKEEEI